MSNQPPPDNPFGAAALSDLIAASLPPNAQPQLATPFDAIAIASHACFLAIGFRLVGLGEDHRIETPSTLEDPQALPESWNSHTGHYSFRYKHSHSSMEYLLQVNKMGSKAVVLGMALGADKSVSIDVSAREFVSEGNLPASPSRVPGNKDDIRTTMGNIFITVGRLSDYGSMIRVKIIQKLIPGLSKAGAAEETADDQDAQRQADADQRRAERAGRDPLRDDRFAPRQPLRDRLARPRPPVPEPIPGFEDEHEILRPQRGGVDDGFGPRLGDRDLYPAGLGPRDPLYGGVGPSLDPRGGGGGMHPTFDDPLFTGQGGQGRRGPDFDMQNPPGSRYDQVGPGNRHPRGAGFGGRPPNPFGGYGDNDFI